MLYTTYRKLQQHLITEIEAAQAFGMTVKQLRFQITRQGNRLPLILKTLDAISQDKMSRQEAAELLQVSVRQVNHLQGTWKVDRPIKEYLIHKAAARVKWEIRKKYASDFISGSSSLEEASELAGVSTRQMRRWVAELLEKHYQMPFVDLKLVSLPRRRRMADEIDEAEGLETAKQNVLAEVAKGARALQEVALERVKSRHSQRGRSNVRE